MWVSYTSGVFFFSFDLGVEVTVLWSGAAQANHSPL